MSNGLGNILVLIHQYMEECPCFCPAEERIHHSKSHSLLGTLLVHCHQGRSWLFHHRCKAPSWPTHRSKWVAPHQSRSTDLHDLSCPLPSLCLVSQRRQSQAQIRRHKFWACRHQRKAIWEAVHQSKWVEVLLLHTLEVHVDHDHLSCKKLPPHRGAPARVPS